MKFLGVTKTLMTQMKLYTGYILLYQYHYISNNYQQQNFLQKDCFLQQRIDSFTIIHSSNSRIKSHEINIKYMSKHNFSTYLNGAQETVDEKAVS